MNKVLEQAIEKIRSLPDDAQEYAASVLEQIAASGGEVYKLSESERAAVREGLADLDAGRIVPDAEIAAFWNRNSA